MAYTICIQACTHRQFTYTKLAACMTCTQTCIGIHEKMCTKIFNSSCPVADIFYPIFMQTITVLVGFTQKQKIIWGFCTHSFTKALSWTPGGLTTPPRPLAAIVSGLTKNRCVHIFSILSLDIL